MALSQQGRSHNQQVCSELLFGRDRLNNLVCLSEAGSERVVMGLTRHSRVSSRMAGSAKSGRQLAGLTMAAMSDKDVVRKRPIE